MTTSDVSALETYSENRSDKGLDKRLVFGALGVAAIALTFWTSSRYPALDEKASLGGDNDISALAFDQIVKVSSSDSVLWKITGNALNWAYTNKQGMFFGILFAAAIMTLLQLLVQKQFKGRFANTLLGVSIGAPLGVCVNCAVPIAMGVQKSGGRTETSLAVLLSSPSLNMVVLSMTFAIFPFWLAALKVSVTLAFIILAIPLAVKLFGPSITPAESVIDDVLDTTPSLGEKSNPSTRIYDRHDPLARTNWLRAFIWYVRGFGENLWYIFKITVPLMILAGILGSIVVTLLPWEALAALVPTGGLAWVLGIGLVAILGTFLPVPIAFDVVICAVLLAAGVDPTYVAVLLLTLGLFSIYPALQIGHSISRKLAIGLFAMVAMTGIATGFAANGLEAFEERRQQTAIASGLARQADVEASSIDSKIGSDVTIINTLGIGRAVAAKDVFTASDGVTITKIPFAKGFIPDEPSDKLFSRIYGPEIGLNMADGVSPLRFLEPIARTHSISTGDVHGDGWPDVVLTSDDGLALFANMGGKKFERQSISASGIDLKGLVRAALVDLDGDKDLDILAASHWDGVYILENMDGRFVTPAFELPGHVEGAITSAFAFGDLDQDGTLEIVVGKSAIGNNTLNRTSSVAQNYILSRVDDQWVSKPLSGPEGETLSILISDLNRDGRPDLMIGNDYRPPDHLYFSNELGALERANRGRIRGGTTRWTMSLATGDIDGDLVPEIYAGNISGRAAADSKNPASECRYETAQERQKCEDRLSAFTPLQPARRQGDAIGCNAIEDNIMAEGCAMIAMTQAIMRRGGTGTEAVGDLCERIPNKWLDFKRMCETRRDEVLVKLSEQEIKETLPSFKQTNVLLKRDPKNGIFNDIAERASVDNGGWTWNARFADLDNDADLDLYVVNGHGMAVNRYDDKYFENSAGEFVNRPEEAGLASGLPATAYSYVDFDQDGDLDIMTLPLLGPAKVFVNTAAQLGSNSIGFQLENKSGNSSAIGAEIIIRYAGGAQIREIQMSGGFASFDEPVAHFGLGDIEQVDFVEIRWPDGEVTRTQTPLAAGAHYNIQRN